MANQYKIIIPRISSEYFAEVLDDRAPTEINVYKLVGCRPQLAWNFQLINYPSVQRYAISADGQRVAVWDKNGVEFVIYHMSGKYDTFSKGSLLDYIEPDADPLVKLQGTQSWLAGGDTFKYLHPERPPICVYDCLMRSPYDPNREQGGFNQSRRATLSGLSPCGNYYATILLRIYDQPFRINIRKLPGHAIVSSIELRVSAATKKWTPNLHCIRWSRCGTKLAVLFTVRVNSVMYMAEARTEIAICENVFDKCPKVRFITRKRTFATGVVCDLFWKKGWFRWSLCGTRLIVVWTKKQIEVFSIGNREKSKLYTVDYEQYRAPIALTTPDGRVIPGLRGDATDPFVRWTDASHCLYRDVALRARVQRIAFGLEARTSSRRLVLGVAAALASRCSGGIN